MRSSLIACAAREQVMVAQYSNKPEISAPVRAEGEGEGGVRGLFPPQIPPGGDGRVLLVTVTNVQFPVNVEVGAPCEAQRAPLPALRPLPQFRE